MKNEKIVIFIVKYKNNETIDKKQLMWKNKTMKQILVQNKIESIRFRLIMAASYMTSSNLPLKTVAAMNGFSSFTYVSSAFSAYFGVCPREYRKRW